MQLVRDILEYRNAKFGLELWRSPDQKVRESLQQYPAIVDLLKELQDIQSEG